MRCDLYRKNLDPFLDGEVDGAMGREMDSHEAECNACTEFRHRRESLRRTLRSLPITPPEDGFLDAIVEDTVISQHKAESRFKLTAALGGTIAAAVVAWLVLVLPTNPLAEHEDSLDTVMITMNESKTFRLTFESESELQAAAISVELPIGVEIVGYDGQDSVRWTTDITPGTNILELPIIVRHGNGGAILARLEHEGKHKSFEFAVEVI